MKRTTLMVLALAGAAPGVELARDGQPTASIVLPADATATVRLAAEELARYLERVSGARLPVVDEAAQPAGPVVHVGPTDAARAAFPELDHAERDTIALLADGRRLVVAGRGDFATLHAVYRLLEHLGCRFLAPDQEYLPSLKTVAVEGLDLVSTPAFELRTFVGRQAARAAWGVKLGLNGFYSAEDAARYDAHQLLPETHTYHRFIAPSRYFADHQEWFPVLSGERRPGGVHEGQLCVTAAGLADEFAKNVSALIDDNPGLEYVSISPNDGMRWCECEACLELDKRLCGGRTTSLGLTGERPFVGDRVFWFTNEVARRVGGRYPEVKLVCLAYVNYAEPPDSVRLEPNVVPWLCHYAPADYSRPIADPTSEPNKLFSALLLRWVERRPDLLYYGYVGKSMWWRLPRPVLHQFAGDVKSLHGLGVRRYYAQSALSDWSLDGPMPYVIAKLLWEPRLSPDAVAADWCRHMYGAAAEAMTAFYRRVEESVLKTGQSYSDNPPKQVPGLYDAGLLEQAAGDLESALKQADSDQSRARVEAVAKTFAYGRAVIASLTAAAEYQREPTLEALRTVREQGEAALKLSNHPDFRKWLERQGTIGPLGVVAQGLGEPEQRGGRTCYNTDETGPGDGQAGWAAFLVPVADPTRPAVLELDVWGTSQLAAISVDTEGLNRSFAAGGKWTSLMPRRPLSGQEQWDTLTYDLPPTALAPRRKLQRIGFGGADSQIWLSGIRIKQDE